MKSREERIVFVENLSRAEILKLCRAVGITAHQLKTNHDLAVMLIDSIDAAREATA